MRKHPSHIKDHGKTDKASMLGVYRITRLAGQVLLSVEIDVLYKWNNKEQECWKVIH
jgi:hypothetical protein